MKNNHIVAEEQGHISAFQLPRRWSHICCWQTDCREWDSKGAYIDQHLSTSLVIVCYFYSAPVTCLIQFSIFQAVWPHSGHYRPTEANFREFMNYLKNRNVDLTNVKVKKQIRVLYHLSPGTKTYLHCPFFF